MTILANIFFGFLNLIGMLFLFGVGLAFIIGMIFIRYMVIDHLKEKKHKKALVENQEHQKDLIDLLQLQNATPQTESPLPFIPLSERFPILLEKMENAARENNSLCLQDAANAIGLKIEDGWITQLTIDVEGRGHLSIKHADRLTLATAIVYYALASKQSGIVRESTIDDPFFRKLAREIIVPDTVVDALRSMGATQEKIARRLRVPTALIQQHAG